ncbi:hypothetical protein [Bradyrhizobium sp. AUGA SZCCT0283]|uniref:hypothetical protein n=1 Tax=Bradyrhizobium sp. AUGA SZCCT0283 TaxID=2807671 RepID=UPI001BA8B1A3|nr:hypothetical protein [Bradyrhizobium sp. AUGA SZCCT0283]MBR1274515.1 hypothetical protein [Bradyrhizobium sp. AUGA SZCCT0283]
MGDIAKGLFYVTRADWLSLLALGISIALPIITLAGRKWFIAQIERGVQHKFDQKIEKLRSELRMSETEISTLRAQVFSGAGKRGELLDKRRFLAVDNTWAAMGTLAPYRLVSEMFMRIDLKVVEADASHPNLQRFFGAIAGIAPKEVSPNLSARAEQLYLSPLAWAYFHAYQTTVLMHFTMIKGLEHGLSNVSKLVKLDRLREILKAALPKDAKFIDECEVTDFALFLEDLEKALAVELQKILDGREADQSDLARARAIEAALKTLPDTSQPRE